ncbi:MAG: hypothetical protein C0617_09440 [Desulfuromonas sp.]|uniref:HD-GYP domain-containing protein n=1 Tax=Desulfuromonas sp. TaxID=892 RepID=UPI000CB53010|nr:HD domain-containing phosphohydrolase [Desulfuromonas sp.]PLX84035.1 MAG: hypothetical protein C0617_09440 [Desulfuromonas sp.]
MAGNLKTRADKVAAPRRGKRSATEKGWLPVALKSLHPERYAPCDLYRRLGVGQHVLFARRGLSFSRTDRQKLFAHGVSHLFIRQADAARYFRYVREILSSVVRDPATSPENKAATVHAACQDIMRQVFEEPRAVFVSQAHEVIAPTLDLITADDKATRCLVRLTAYDHSTYTHSANVGIFAAALSRIIFGKKADRDLERIGPGFFLHDLGKCRIPLEILNKPGPLDPGEWEVVKRHPGDGVKILEESGFLTDEARIIALQHHEKDDGSGYPHGLKGGDIHPLARICRLADVYEALTSKRPYHQRRSTYEALKLMKETILVDMDREFFDHFVRLFRS